MPEILLMDLLIPHLFYTTFSIKLLRQFVTNCIHCVVLKTHKGWDEGYYTDGIFRIKH